MVEFRAAFVEYESSGRPEALEAAVAAFKLAAAALAMDDPGYTACALNAASGVQLWDTLLGIPDTLNGAGSSGPFAAGGTVYIGDQNGNVYALDAKTGNVVWHYDVIQYAFPAAAAVRGGTEPDLLDEVAWWQTDDFWQYAMYAAVAHIRAAASCAGVPVRQACEDLNERPPTRLYNAESVLAGGTPR